MKINKVEVLVAKTEVKTNKENKEYFMANIITVPDGDAFAIMVRDMSLLPQLKPFSKVKVNLNLSSSQYGLRVDIVDILEVTGGI